MYAFSLLVSLLFSSGSFFLSFSLAVLSFSVTIDTFSRSFESLADYTCPHTHMHAHKHAREHARTFTQTHANCDVYTHTTHTTHGFTPVIVLRTTAICVMTVASPEDLPCNPPHIVVKRTKTQNKRATHLQQMT